MEHILQFAVDIDDQKIVNAVESNAVKQIIDGIKIDILNRIFTKGYYNSNAVIIDAKGVKLSPEAEFSGFAKNIIEDAIDDLKPEIINAAADKLVESYKRTKAWKDRAEKELDTCDIHQLNQVTDGVDKLLAEKLVEQKRYSHEDLGILGQ